MIKNVFIEGERLNATISPNGKHLNLNLTIADYDRDAQEYIAHADEFSILELTADMKQEMDQISLIMRLIAGSHVMEDVKNEQV